MSYAQNAPIYTGLSADTKPTTGPGGVGSSLLVGTRFIAVDTGVVYDWNGSAWIVALTPDVAGAAGGGAVTIANGADAAEGTTTDTPFVGAEDGTARTGISLWKGIKNALGIISGAAVVTDANGTIQQYLRGLVKLWIAGLAAGEAHVGKVGGQKVRVSAAFTRPSDTTAYAAKDTVANATSGAVVMTFTGMARVTGGSGYIVKASILTSQTTNTEAFRLHLYNAAPTALQDNAACTAPLYADGGSYVGTIDFPACKTEGTGGTAAYVNVTGNIANSNLPMAFVCAADANLYGILETPAGFTPASAQTFTIVLVAEVD